MYSTSSKLPRGPHGLPREVVERSQRRRLVEATARLVAERGYAGTRVADVASLAGVSRSTFYEQFADKEALFLACYQAGSDTHRRRVERALEAAGGPARQAREAIAAYLAMLEDDAAAAGAFFVEAQVATPAIRRRFLANQDAYADMVGAWHERSRGPRSRPVPRLVWAGVVAGIAGLVTERIHRRGVEGIVDELTEPCLELVLAVAGVRRRA